MRTRTLMVLLSLTLLLLSGAAPGPMAHAAPAMPPWSTDERVNDVTAGDQEYPAIAVGPDGARYVVWRDNASAIRFAYGPPSGGWEASQVVFTGSNIGTPDIAVDPDGNAYAVWSSDGSVYFASRPAGGSWSSPQQISTDPGAYSDPSIAVDDAGNLYAVWGQNGGSSQSIIFCQRPAGGDWGNPSSLWTYTSSGGEKVLWDVRLAVTPTGRAHLLWAVELETFRIYSAHRADDGTWGEPEILDQVASSADEGLTNVSIAIAADAQNYVHAVWGLCLGVWDGGFVVVPPRYARRAPDGTWSAADQVPGIGPGEWYLFGRLDVEAGPAGSAYVSFVVSLADYVRYVKHDASGDWGPIMLVSDQSQGRILHLAIAARGATVHVVWQDGSSDLDIYYSALGAPSLRASSPAFLPQSAFAPGQTLLLYTVLPGLGSDCCADRNEDMYVVLDGDTAHPLLMTNDGAGLHDRTHPDLAANDCHHSLWLQLSENRTYTLDLYAVPHGQSFDESYWVDTLQLSPLSQPRLFVLTDLRELFNEFNATSSNSAIADVNVNCTADYYDALERIRQYAAAHQGVVLDVRQDAYTDDYTYSKAADRRTMGSKIDLLIRELPDTWPWTQYIAIIGDDAVVPFYRYPDPQPNDESRYLRGDAHGVGTVVDTHSNYIITDVPYSTRSNAVPQAPKPDLDLGRIFASRPLFLTEMIDAYEQPLILGGKTGSAFVFNLADDPKIHWQENTRSLVIEPLYHHFGYTDLDIHVAGDLSDLGKPRHLGWVDGQSGSKWTGNTVKTALDKGGGNRLTVLNSHASHYLNTTAVKKDYFEADLLDALPAFPGAILVNVGCHGGYTTGFDATAGSKKRNYYTDALARGAMEQHYAYHGSTTYGKTTGTKVLRYHDQIHYLFLAGVAGMAWTTGEAHRRSIYLYSGPYGDVSSTSDIIALYGTELYGLPTQPIRNTPGKVTVKRVAGVPDAYTTRGAQAGQALTVTLMAPHFAISTDEAGATWFAVPHGGRWTAQGDGPYVPLLIRSLYFPAGTTDLSVSLVATETAPYAGAVQLPLQQVGDRSFGVSIIPYTGTTPYPDALFWTTTYTDTPWTQLALSAVPLRYDPTTGQATLIHQMEFQVMYNAPATGVQVQSLTINDGDPVALDQTTVPLSATLTTTATQPLTLTWLIEDQGATPVRSGTAVFTPTVGSNEISWNTDSQGWLPGPKVLHVLLADESGAVVATAQQPFTAQGRSLLLSTNRGLYGPGDGQAVVRVEVRDESGAEVTGLTAAFTQTLDGAPLALAWREGGSYTAALELSALSDGTHLLSVTLDGETAAQVAFALDREPPTSTLHSPATSTEPFTVTVSGGDDVSGVESYVVQYRVGEGGAWTDWLTLPAGWDYSQGEPADLSPTFGPLLPVALRRDTTYYFRVRAVDRAGNQEAEHALADTATTYTGPDRFAYLYLPLVLRR